MPPGDPAGRSVVLSVSLGDFLFQDSCGVSDTSRETPELSSKPVKVSPHSQVPNSVPGICGYETNHAELSSIK